MDDNKISYTDQIREIIYSEWNPIGGEDLPADEYDGYLERVSAFLTKSKVDIRELANLLIQWETNDFGLNIQNSRSMWIAGLLLAVQHPFRRQLADHMQQLDDVINTFSITDQVDTNLSEMKKVMDLLWELPWEAYRIDELSSSLEVLGDSLQEGLGLRVLMVHREVKLNHILNENEFDQVHVEIVMGTYDVTLTYPGGHVHLLYEEVIELLPALFEQGWKMKYWFQGERLMASGLWDEGSRQYMTVKRLKWNPLQWLDVLIQQNKRSEREYTLTWRNES